MLDYDGILFRWKRRFINRGINLVVPSLEDENTNKNKSKSEVWKKNSTKHRTRYLSLQAFEVLPSKWEDMNDHFLAPNFLTKANNCASSYVDVNESKCAKRTRGGVNSLKDKVPLVTTCDSAVWLRLLVFLWVCEAQTWGEQLARCRMFENDFVLLLLGNSSRDFIAAEFLPGEIPSLRLRSLSLSRSKHAGTGIQPVFSLRSNQFFLPQNQWSQQDLPLVRSPGNKILFKTRTGHVKCIPHFSI